MNIQKELFLMQDIPYGDFHSRLMPTVCREKIIGVRVPALRKFSKSIFGTAESEKFLTKLPHRYYEEDNVHAFLLEQIKDYDRAIEETEKFLPFIDNWATCDMFRPPVFKRNKDRLILKIHEWIESDRVYTVRYAIGLLLSFYLDEDYKKEYLELVCRVKSDEYYINMMIAWFFATALAKQYDDAILYLTQNRLDADVHNKTIRKAVESNRISTEKKNYLKTLKKQH